MKKGKSFNQKIIDTKNLVKKGRKQGHGEGTHFIVDGDVAKRYNDYCMKNFIIKRKLLQKIVSDFLDKQDNSH